jgi:hypothetical protein
MVKFNMEFDWKEHSVDLEALEVWLKENAGEHYCGNSADVKLKLHFLEEPSEEVKAEIEAKMAELDDPEHEMCKSYKPQEQRKQEKAQAKQAAIAALASVSGLSAEQIKALLS